MVPIEKIIFIDIETAPLYPALKDMPEDLQRLYIERCEKDLQYAKSKGSDLSHINNENNPELKFGGTGLRAEFGKVICISMGRFEKSDSNLLVHSIAMDNEKALLEEFIKYMNKYSNFVLCAHNGKNFDYPFLGRRILINGLKLPEMLSFVGKKPWEIPHLDTMEMWGFAAKSANTVSLKTLCAVFGIPSPKDDIDGSQVAEVYYNEKNLERIVKYCERDVEALAAVYKRM